MKRLFIIALTACSCFHASAEQGYFLFANTVGTSVWDGFTSNIFQKSPGTVYVGLMWSADTSAAPLIGNSPTPTNASYEGNWALILNDSNFQRAMVSGTNLFAQTRTGPTFIHGTFNKGVIALDEA